MVSLLIQCLPVFLLVAFVFAWRNSLPFAWSIRMFIPYAKIQKRSMKEAIFGSKQVEIKYNNHNNVNEKSNELITSTTSLSAQGCDPFDDTWIFNQRVNIDDCDFNGQMSNSSFPRNLDIARMNFTSNRFGDFVTNGGWIALAGTSFQFHQEILPFVKYNINIRIETWTDKWLYLRNEFKGKKNGQDLLYCTAITKHCFKYGRKTIPPWFVLAFCGYTGACGATLLKTNATRSKELRQQLKQFSTNNKRNAFASFERIDQTGLKKSPIWCDQRSWDVEGWEFQRKENLQKLLNDF